MSAVQESDRRYGVSAVQRKNGGVENDEGRGGRGETGVTVEKNQQ